MHACTTPALATVCLGSVVTTACCWPDERYQDFLSVFSNDGITGQWIVLREWWFRSCCSAMGGRVEKFKANVASNEVIAADARAPGG